MIVGKEHQSVMSNHVSFICVPGQHHLAANCLLGGSDAHLFTVFIEHQSASFATYKVMRPEHQSDYLALEPLLPQTFSQVIRQATNSRARLVSVGGMREAYASILTHWWSVGNHQAAIFTISHLVKPRAKSTQATTQSLFRQCR